MFSVHQHRLKAWRTVSATSAQSIQLKIYVSVSVSESNSQCAEQYLTRRRTIFGEINFPGLAQAISNSFL